MSDTSAQRLSRMLALVPWLIEHDGVTITETARHFGVSEQQLEDDLWLVILCGVPGYLPDQLIDIDFWDDGRIRVIEPLTLRRPLRLSHEESLTLLVALRLLAQVPNVANREAISSAAAKLENAVGSTAQVASMPISGTVNDGVMRTLEEAGHEPVRITYGSGTDDGVTERIIEVDRIFSVDGIVYLDSYCHRAGAQRTFRLDRILMAELSSESASPRLSSEADPGSAAGEGPERVDVLLKLAPEARWLVDVYGAEVLSQDPFTVRLPALSDAWAVRLVMSLGGSAELVEPPPLRLAVLKAACEAREAYRQA